MRIAIFSDVHANLEALTAVLRAYDKERIDQYVCLGDVVGYGASPNQVCNIVRQISAHTILGNHDAAVAGRMDYSYYYEAARHALDKHAAELSRENMAWLRSLPYKVSETRYAFCHGSPVNIEEFEYIFALEQAQRTLVPHFGDFEDVIFVGHSHLCRAFAYTPERAYECVANKFEIRPGHKYVISVGSVGQPRDNDARASYTIFDTEAMTFEFLRVEYDIETSARKIFETDLEPNFGHRLFRGV